MPEPTEAEVIAAIQAGEWCYSCCEIEPLPENPFQVCGECMHYWATEQELVDDYNRVVDEINEEEKEIVCERVTSGDQVFCCPRCIHDF